MDRIRLQSNDGARRAIAHRSRWVVAMLSAAMAFIACSTAQAGTPAMRAPTTKAALASTTVHAATVQKTAVTIRNFAFEPATLSVSLGSKVVWINRDDEPHLVVSAGGQFPASPALDTDDSYATVFSKPGTYTYFCSIHPHMVGTIIVK